MAVRLRQPGRQSLAVDRMAELDRQGRRPFGKLGRGLVGVQADAEYHRRTRRPLQQDAGQFLPVEEHVVGPLQLRGGSGRELHAARDRDRGQQWQQRKHIDRWLQDCREEQGLLDGCRP